MEYHIYSHRNGEIVMENDSIISPLWGEIKEVIEDISEDDIINLHSSKYINSNKSISKALNELFKDRFKSKGWKDESYIFKNEKYKNKAWRLDFAKDAISIEVGFNHAGTIAWNLMKPVISSELNHIEKAIQTKIGVIICSTNDLQMAGGFDNAIGTYEKYIDHLLPLRVQLTTPLVIIGLKKVTKFYIKPYNISPSKTLGKIIMTRSNSEFVRFINSKYICVKNTSFKYYKNLSNVL